MKKIIISGLTLVVVGAIVAIIFGVIFNDKNIDTDTNNNKNNEVCNINCDMDNDGYPDLNIDFNNDKIPHFNVDTNNDKVADYNLLNQDVNNDNKCDLNCDTNNDGRPDINIDKDGDANCDLRCEEASSSDDDSSLSLDKPSLSTSDRPRSSMSDGSSSNISNLDETSSDESNSSNQELIVYPTITSVNYEYENGQVNLLVMANDSKGLVSYYYSDSATKPDDNVTWTNNTSKTFTISNVLQNKKYYVWVKNKDNNISQSKSISVPVFNYAINSEPIKYAASLNEAVEKSATGAIISLLTDVNDTVPTIVDKNITLNLNHKLTTSSSITINDNKKLTITGANDLEGTGSNFLINHGELAINSTGKIISTLATNTIDNKGVLTLGTKDENAPTGAPYIEGIDKTILSTGTFNYYDGTIITLNNKDGITGTVTETPSEYGYYPIIVKEATINKTTLEDAYYNVNDKYAKSLEEALNVAQTDDTITLIRDRNEVSTNINKSVNLVLNANLTINDNNQLTIDSDKTVHISGNDVSLLAVNPLDGTTILNNGTLYIDNNESGELDVVTTGNTSGTILNNGDLYLNNNININGYAYGLTNNGNVTLNKAKTIGKTRGIINNRAGIITFDATYGARVEASDTAIENINGTVNFNKGTLRVNTNNDLIIGDIILPNGKSLYTYTEYGYDYGVVETGMFSITNGDETKYYHTLKSAIASASVDDNIVMLEDYTEDEYVTIDKNITLTINDKLTTTNNISIASQANVTINGIGEISSDASRVLYNRGTLTVNNVKLTSLNNTVVYNTTAQSLTINDSIVSGNKGIENYRGTMNLDNTTIVATSSNALELSSETTNNIIDSSVTSTMDKGIINSGTTILEDTDINAYNQAIYQMGTLTLKSGTITSSNDAAIELYRATSTIIGVDNEIVNKTEPLITGKTQAIAMVTTDDMVNMYDGKLVSTSKMYPIQFYQNVKTFNNYKISIDEKESVTEGILTYANYKISSGNIYAETFSEAYEKVTGTSFINVINDYTETENIVIDKDINLLLSKNLTLTNEITINSGKTLNIYKDYESNGQIIKDGSDAIINNGKLVIRDGAINTTGNAIINNDDLFVSGGSVSSTNGIAITNNDPGHLYLGNNDGNILTEPTLYGQTTIKNTGTGIVSYCDGVLTTPSVGGKLVDGNINYYANGYGIDTFVEGILLKSRLVIAKYEINNDTGIIHTDTLAKAIDKVDENGTIKLLTNMTEPPVTVNKSFNLDLDRKTLTFDYDGDLDDAPSQLLLINEGKTLNILVSGSILSNDALSLINNNGTLNIGEYVHITNEYDKAIVNTGNNAVTNINNGFIQGLIGLVNNGTGQINILSKGIIETTDTGIINNGGTINLGIIDGEVINNSINIRGENVGILVNSGTLNYYEGTIIGINPYNIDSNATFNVEPGFEPIISDFFAPRKMATLNANQSPVINGVTFEEKDAVDDKIIATVSINENIKSYYISTSNTAPQTNEYDTVTATNSLVINDLEPNTTYYLWVRDSYNGVSTMYTMTTDSVYHYAISDTDIKDVTLAGILDKANAYDTINVLKTTNDSSEINIDKPITINLNYDVTLGSNQVNIASTGNLVLEGEKSFKSTVKSDALVVNNGLLTLNGSGGIVNQLGIALDNKSTEYDSVTINNGVLSGTTAIVNNDYGDIIINMGESVDIEGTDGPAIDIVYGTVTLGSYDGYYQSDNFEIKGVNSAINIEEDGYLFYYDGKIISLAQGEPITGDNISIEDGLSFDVVTDGTIKYTRLVNALYSIATEGQNIRYSERLSEALNIAIDGSIINIIQSNIPGDYPSGATIDKNVTLNILNSVYFGSPIYVNQNKTLTITGNGSSRIGFANEDPSESNFIYNRGTITMNSGIIDINETPNNTAINNYNSESILNMNGGQIKAYTTAINNNGGTITLGNNDGTITDDILVSVDDNTNSIYMNGGELNYYDGKVRAGQSGTPIYEESSSNPTINKATGTQIKTAVIGDYLTATLIIANYSISRNDDIISYTSTLNEAVNEAVSGDVITLLRDYNDVSTVNLNNKDLTLVINDDLTTSNVINLNSSSTLTLNGSGSITASNTRTFNVNGTLNVNSGLTINNDANKETIYLASSNAILNMGINDEEILTGPNIIGTNYTDGVINGVALSKINFYDGNISLHVSNVNNVDGEVIKSDSQITLDVPTSYVAENSINDLTKTTNLVSKNYEISGVGSTEYTDTLQKAINKASSTETITVLENIADNSNPNVNKDITIDLDNNILTLANQLNIASDAELTLVGNGSIIGTVNNLINNEGTLNNNSVTISTTGNVTINNIGTTNFGINDEDISLTKPSLVGIMNGILGGTFNYYDGVVTSSTSGTPIDVTSLNVPNGYGVDTSLEATIKKATLTIANYSITTNDVVQKRATLADAINASRDNSVIKLLKDMTETPVVINKDITLNLNNHTLDMIKHDENDEFQGMITVNDGNTFTLDGTGTMMVYHGDGIKNYGNLIVNGDLLLNSVHDLSYEYGYHIMNYKNMTFNSGTLNGGISINSENGIAPNTTILGGTIRNAGNGPIMIYTELGTTTIGSKDDPVNKTSPSITGAINAIYTLSDLHPTINFYDGILTTGLDVGEIVTIPINSNITVNIPDNCILVNHTTATNKTTTLGANN